MTDTTQTATEPAPTLAIGSAAELPAATLPAAPLPGFQLIPQPRTFDEVRQLCSVISNTDLVPKDFRGKPGNVLIAIQMGADVGLSWAQAIQNVAVINGRPAMWGDAVLGICRASGVLDWISEREITDPETGEVSACVCRVKRRLQDPIERGFSMADARTAGLAGKPGPWQQYPRRMLQMRARSWALRDAFGDVLKGLAVREEIGDQIDAATDDGRTWSVPAKTGPGVAGLAARVNAKPDPENDQKPAGPGEPPEIEPEPAPVGTSEPDRPTGGDSDAPPRAASFDLPELLADVATAADADALDLLLDVARALDDDDADQIREAVSHRRDELGIVR